MANDESRNIFPKKKVPQAGVNSSMTMLSPHAAVGGQRSLSHSRNPSTASTHFTHHCHHRASHATSKSCHSSVGMPHSGVTSRFRWFGWLLRGASRYEIEDTVTSFFSVSRFDILFRLVPPVSKGRLLRVVGKNL